MTDYSEYEWDSIIEGMLAPDCHPTHFNLTADFDKIVGKSSEEVESLKLHRYYTSELIDIKPGENPPYSVLDKIDTERKLDETMQFRDFGIKISALRDADDTCDKEGIKFIAKFLAHYSDNGKELSSVKPHIRDYVLGVLSPHKLKDLNIISLAKKAINSEE